MRHVPDLTSSMISLCLLFDHVSNHTEMKFDTTKFLLKTFLAFCMIGNSLRLRA